jgi:hypothetical protein
MTSRVLVAVVSLAAVALVAAPSGSAAPGGMCRPGSPAVAHHAGGAVVKVAAVRVPCGSETGYYTGETGIGVTRDGHVWFSAADWEWAMVHSVDNGRSWQRVVAEGPQAQPGCYVATSPATCQDTEAAKNGTVADAYLWVDPATSKVFWSKTYGFAVCSSLSMTADDGKTWRSVSQFACPGADYEKIAGGPPPAGGVKPVGYPSVLYACTNGPVPWFVVGPGRPCYKSLDGGSTWNFAGFPLPSPQAPGCLHFQEAHAVGPDGTVFLPISCGGNNASALVRVALSHDEGTTWSYVAVPTGEVGNGAGLIGGVSLAVDKAGVVYVVWRGTDQRPYLAVSRDQGRTWRGPLMVGAPGVTTGGPTPQVVAQNPGHIAIGYYGYTGKDSTRLSGYLTESFNATASVPLFHSAAVNDPKKPLYFPVSSGTLPRNDYLGVAFGPDGTPWVGLVKLLSPKPDAEGYIQSTGFAGHLVSR